MNANRREIMLLTAAACRMGSMAKRRGNAHKVTNKAFVATTEVVFGGVRDDVARGSTAVERSASRDDAMGFAHRREERRFNVRETASWMLASQAF